MEKKKEAKPKGSVFSKIEPEKKVAPKKKKNRFAPIVTDLGDGKFSTTYPRRTRVIVRQKKQ